MSFYIKNANPLGTFVDSASKVVIRRNEIKKLESLSQYMKSFILNKGLIQVSEEEYNLSQGISVSQKEEVSVDPTQQSPVSLGNEVDSPIMENPSSPEGKTDAEIPAEAKNEEESNPSVEKTVERKRRRL